MLPSITELGKPGVGVHVTVRGGAIPGLFSMQEQRHAYLHTCVSSKGIKIHSENNPLFDAEKSTLPAP